MPTDVAATELLEMVGAPSADARLEIDGSDPVLPTRLALGEAAAAVIAAFGTLVASLWQLRGGNRQLVRVDVRHAAASLLSMAINRIDGEPLPVSERQTAGKGLYEASDGRWVQVHDGFPHLADGLSQLLECPLDRDSLTAAVSQWNSFELEDALAARGLCGSVARTPAEWRSHPQALAVGDAPVVVEKVGDAPVEEWRSAPTPLAGCRVLDLTRLLAGPLSTQLLASFGADVLKVSSPRLPSVEAFDIDTGHGKRAAHIDLDDPDGVRSLQELVSAADVFVDSYRGGSLARRGFGAEALADMRPGIVAVSVSCFGHVGPWSTRPGFEQIAQAATGLSVLHGGERSPALLPAAVTDYMTGYFAALGTVEALRRRATEGGSWAVRASLSQTGAWLARTARLVDELPAAGASFDDLIMSTHTPWGELTHLRPPLQMDETPPAWSRPPVPLGTHPPAWLSS